MLCWRPLFQGAVETETNGRNRNRINPRNQTRLRFGLLSPRRFRHAWRLDRTIRLNQQFDDATLRLCCDLTCRLRSGRRTAGRDTGQKSKAGKQAGQHWECDIASIGLIVHLQAEPSNKFTIAASKLEACR